MIALGGADGQISVHYSDGRLERHWEGHCEGSCLQTKDCNNEIYDTWFIPERSQFQQIFLKAFKLKGTTSLRIWFHCENQLDDSELDLL